MFHQEFAPPEELRNTIKCFWHNIREANEQQPAFEVVPDGYAEIIFYFGGDLSIVLNGEPQPLPSPFMMGLMDQPAHFFAKDRLEIIGVRCYPWTVFNVLGLPPAKDGIRLLEHPVAQHQGALKKLTEANNVADAIALVVKYFVDARIGIAPNNLLLKAGAAMSRANGTILVSQVAEAAHATVRTLERNFKSSSGYSVKDVSGLMRFEQVRNHLWQNPGVNLAGLAHELGYSDQPHLSREFKRYSGTTPSAFARQAKKQKPMISNNFVAFIQA
ncbi:helix-turn-helix domain-containing protein [Mucilaginibacter lutimaris]|uniref:Helix-turn-helix domain-containing protein n=1 Tax=Mucilaginibacter lutimaris TaxID=931629 RepID=A0ABW2ZBF9_9SPHI